MPPLTIVGSGLGPYGFLCDAAGTGLKETTGGEFSVGLRGLGLRGLGFRV